MNDRLERLERMLEQMFVRGSIEAVDCEGKRVRVRYGPDSVSDWVEWKPQRSGLVTVWSPPQVGEGCTIISPGDINLGEVFLGSYHGAMPPPSVSPDETVMQWPDGTVVRYNMAEHKLSVNVAGDASVEVSGSAQVSVGEDLNAKVAGSGTIDCSGSCSVKAGGSCSINGASVLLGGGGAGVVTGKHICAFTGAPHGDCSSKVKAG